MFDIEKAKRDELFTGSSELVDVVLCWLSFWCPKCGNQFKGGLTVEKRRALEDGRHLLTFIHMPCPLCGSEETHPHVASGSNVPYTNEWPLPLEHYVEAIKYGSSNEDWIGPWLALPNFNLLASNLEVERSLSIRTLGMPKDEPHEL